MLKLFTKQTTPQPQETPRCPNCNCDLSGAHWQHCPRCQQELPGRSGCGGCGACGKHS